jgi:hypothetical protein
MIESTPKFLKGFSAAGSDTRHPIILAVHSILQATSMPKFCCTLSPADSTSKAESRLLVRLPQPEESE